MVTVGDYSIVIPTLNRLAPLIETLDSINFQTLLPDYLIIVDQSDNSDIRDWINKTKYNFKIKYIYQENKSSCEARNRGSKEVKTKYISFLDDDVELESRYYEILLGHLENNDSVVGTTGFIKSKKSNIIFWFIMQFYKSIFLLSDFTNTSKVYWAFGGTYPRTPPKTIIYVQNILGNNSLWRTVIFKKYLFDENLTRYCFKEDTDLAYRIYKSHPKGLTLNANAKLYHKKVNLARIDNRQRIVMKYDYFTYIYFKNFKNSFLNRAIYRWQLLGEIIGLFFTGKLTWFRFKVIIKYLFGRYAKGYSLKNEWVNY